MSNVKYITETDGNRKFGNPTDTQDLTNDLFRIKNQGGDIDNIRNIIDTLSGTLIFHVSDKLFYKLMGGEVTLYSSNVDKVYVSGDKVIILYNENTDNLVSILTDKFQNFSNLFIKDNAYNIDFLLNYMKFTNRDIDDIFVNDNKITIIFGEIK